MSRHHIVESSPLLADLQHHVVGLIAARLSLPLLLIAAVALVGRFAVEMVTCAPAQWKPCYAMLPGAPAACESEMAASDPLQCQTTSLAISGQAAGRLVGLSTQQGELLLLPRSLNGRFRPETGACGRPQLRWVTVGGAIGWGHKVCVGTAGGGVAGRRPRPCLLFTSLRPYLAGKSALLHRLLSGRFRANLPRTYGAEFGAKRVRLPELLPDGAGQPACHRVVYAEQLLNRIALG